jgi:gliding motility-associated-like protein
VFNNLTAGNYTITVRSKVAGSCDGKASEEIKAAVGAPVVTLKATQPTCAAPDAGSLEVTAPLGTDYEYSINGTTFQASPVFNNLTAGNYTITVRSKVAGSCDGKASEEIKAAPLPSSSISDTTVCQGQLPFTWNGQSITAAGTYTFTGKNAAGCDSIAKLNVVVKQTLAGDTTITSVCASEMPYQWNGQTYTSQGTYTLTLRNIAGCDSVVTLILTVNPLATATITEPSTICLGTSKTISISLTGTGPWNVTYTDGTNNYTIRNIASSPYLLTVTPTSTTTYSLLSVQDGKCTNNNPNSSVTITVVQAQQGLRYPTVRTKASTNTQLNARSIVASNRYKWEPNVGLNNYSIQNPIFNYNKDTDYLIRISTDNGCDVVDSLRVLIIEETQSPDIRSNIFVPKAWSPNKDGHNDKLFPLTVNIKELYYFRIFNRWGQLLFETNVIGQGWDGIYKGQPQVSDVYTWTLEAMGMDGQHYKRSGNSVLLR